jgi:hypothetical protein
VEHPSPAQSSFEGRSERNSGRECAEFLELSPTDLTARDLLKQAGGQTSNQLGTQTAESYLTLNLQRYGEERYAEAIAACRAALEIRPNYAEA